MIVKRSKASVTKIAGMFFYPGMNTIDDEAKAKEILADQGFKDQVSAGHMRVVEKSKEVAGPGKKKADEETTSNIGKMNVKDAVDVVKDTLSIPELEKQLKAEERKTVIKAIEKQIEMLRKDEGE